MSDFNTATPIVDSAAVSDAYTAVTMPAQPPVTASATPAAGASAPAAEQPAKFGVASFPIVGEAATESESSPATVGASSQPVSTESILVNHSSDDVVEVADADVEPSFLQAHWNSPLNLLRYSTALTEYVDNVPVCPRCHKKHVVTPHIEDVRDYGSEKCKKLLHPIECLKSLQEKMPWSKYGFSASTTVDVVVPQ